jgi:hypothetical protein
VWMTARYAGRFDQSETLNIVLIAGALISSG